MHVAGSRGPTVLSQKKGECEKRIAGAPATQLHKQILQENLKLEKEALKKLQYSQEASTQQLRKVSHRKTSGM